jgi:hypothetical protein
MGCWNGTCLVSNLPIYSGDEVVFFVLKQKRPGVKLDGLEGGHFYSDDLYEPLLYPIVGEYDDYGCIENVKEDFSLIEKYFEKVELTKDRWDGGNDIFRNIGRGNYKGYTFALIHKDIYDSLIAHLYDRKEWWSKGKGIKDFVVEETKEKAQKYYHDKARWEKVDGGDALMSLFSVEHFVCGRDSNDFFIAKYLETQDEVLFSKLIETHLIHHVLTLCRKFWFPQVGAGSQSSEVDLYETLATKMLEKCKQTRERWDG